MKSLLNFVADANHKLDMVWPEVLGIAALGFAAMSVYTAYLGSSQSVLIEAGFGIYSLRMSDHLARERDKKNNQQENNL